MWPWVLCARSMSLRCRESTSERDRSRRRGWRRATTRGFEDESMLFRSCRPSFSHYRASMLRGANCSRRVISKVTSNASKPTRITLSSVMFWTEYLFLALRFLNLWLQAALRYFKFAIPPLKAERKKIKRYDKTDFSLINSELPFTLPLRPMFTYVTQRKSDYYSTKTLPHYLTGIQPHNLYHNFIPGLVVTFKPLQAGRNAYSKAAKISGTPQLRLDLVSAFTSINMMLKSLS